MNLPGLLNVPHSFNIQTSLSSMTCREGDKGDPSTQRRYQDAQPDDLCRLIQDLLFDHLLDEAHSYQLILKHPLTEKLILWLYNGGGSSAVSSQQVAEELFQVSFIPQGGFLCQDEASTSPWDGGLDPKLLGKVPRTEDSLFLARKVLLRHFLPPSRLKGTTPEDYPGFVHEMARLWPLGSWKQCRDQEMIREAFKFLARCWKALASLPGLGDLQGCSCIQRTEHEGVLLVGAGSRRRAEELLLQMFSDLEVWRLPPADLLTPWVPGQVLAAHVTAQCKELEDRLVSLVDETRENLEELSRLTSVMSGGQPTSMWQRLEATDQRSTQFMQKQAELNNTLRQLQ
ncbi:unnamed protein product [Durusdinium trenchii]|uniref:HAUS augmin-like complex subunit 7 n=1 Tax=Durusdinium trenchii TaxID=1381693 RepID=A0ABP0SX52_9DINO